MSIRLAHAVLREGRRLYKLGGRAYYEPLEWLWDPPTPRVDRDEKTGWNDKERRVGAIGKKVGMLTEYDRWGNMIPITCIQIEKNYVVQVKTEEKEGYHALQVGTGMAKEKNISFQLRHHFLKAGVPFCQKLVEFRVTPGATLPPGTEITVRHFTPGQYLDIQGTTIGKGFQGGMKRWGFSGFPASHGASLSHRSLGSTNSSQDPGRVWKGKKMAGHMGAKTRTVKNLIIFKIDPELNLLLVRGHIPGARGSWLFVKDAKNKLHPRPPPFPTHFASENDSLDLMEGDLPMPYKTKLAGAHPPPLKNETVWETQRRLGMEALTEYRKEQALREEQGLLPDEWIVSDAIEKAYMELEKEKANRS